MHFTSLNAAYQQVLKDVCQLTPESSYSPRNQPTLEILSYHFSVAQPTNGKPIITANEERNAKIAKYTAAESALYDSGTKKVEEYAIASSFWQDLANPDGTINSAYGYLIWKRLCCGNLAFESNTEGHGQVSIMRTPWEWAMTMLKRDQHTRQAIMHFNTPDMLWLGNKDVTCTLTAQFFIRDDMLHLIVNMRSNDVVLGLVYDCVWFASLMHRAVTELKDVYPNLRVGTYYHHAGSMHVYLRNLDVARSMIFEGPNRTQHCLACGYTEHSTAQPWYCPACRENLR